MEFPFQIKHPSPILWGINVGIYKKVAVTGGNSSHEYRNKRKKLGLWNWPAHWGKETAGSLHPGPGHIPAILDISLTAPWPTPGPTGQLPGAAGHFLLRYGLAQGLGPFSLWVKEPAEAETFISSLLRKERVSRRWFCFALFCLVMGSGCLVHDKKGMWLLAT